MPENEEKLKKSRRKRREFTLEFKAGAVTLVLESKSTALVAQDLDLAVSAQQAQSDRGEGKHGALTTAERQELWQLRKRVRQLELEKDILKSRSGLNPSTQHLLQPGRWSVEPQGLSRTLVELESHSVQFPLREGRDVRAIREVLPKEPVRALVSSALRGLLRLAVVLVHRPTLPSAGGLQR